MGLMFFPRGGSSHVARNLATSLPDVGWDVSIVSGSLSRPGGPGDARSFYRGLDVHPVDFTRALDADDPLLADPPLHPSYEDRADAPDRVFASLPDAVAEHQTAAWCRALEAAGARDADVLHLHHLTPLHEAALRAFPGVPLVGELHGTELAFLRELEHGPPSGWTYADAWRGRMRRWAQAPSRLVASAADAAAEAGRLLGVDAARILTVPNGIDPELFDRHALDGAARLAHWRRRLVEDPRGWDESGVPGSVRYTEDDLAPFRAGGPVLLYSGRYTAVKRIPLLVRAHARASRRFSRPAPLVLLGGYPGEWEGEHPLAAVRASGSRDVFLAGWHEHDELPAALNSADLLVLPSVADAFGLVLVEAMACGLPVIACDAHGPRTIVEAGETGWLVPPDDEDALVEALVEAVEGEAERRRRGELAYRRSRERYAWPALARRLARAYESVVDAAGPPPGG